MYENAQNFESRSFESGNVEKEFLDSYPNPRTRKSYRGGLQKFTAWFRKLADEILEMSSQETNR